VEPAELAAQLGVSPRALRDWLRRTYPRGPVEQGSRWDLTRAQSDAARRHFGAEPTPSVLARTERAGRSRDASDEAYVIDLCDEVLGERGLRQPRFHWLRGDPAQSGSSVALPVDAYYPEHQIVVEYRERQHDEPVPHFDKPDHVTVSGVSRGAQRRIYDQRREALIPANGLRLVVVGPADLVADHRGRLRRDRSIDLESLRQLLTL
jgi:hypothetical protein